MAYIPSSGSADERIKTGIVFFGATAGKPALDSSDGFKIDESNDRIIVPNIVIDDGGTIGSTTTTDILTLANDGIATFSSGVVIQGDLTVNGTQVIVNTETVTIDDNILVLNNNQTGSPSQDAGLEVERGDGVNVSFLWNETAKYWSISDHNNITYELATRSGIQELLNKTIDGNKNTLTNIGNGSLVNDSVTVNAGTGLVNGGEVALGGSITINLAAGNGLLPADNLVSVKQGSGILVDGLGVHAVVGTGLSLNTNGVQVNYDNSTIGINGSDQLYVKALGITGAELAADSVDGSKIADNSINSEHYVDGSVDNIHLANSSISITAGTGLKTGGSVSLGGTVQVDIDLNDLPVGVIANGDSIAFIDANDSNATKKESIADVASLFAGNGLTSSSSAINVVGGTGLTASANSLDIDATLITAQSVLSGAVEGTSDYLLIYDNSTSSLKKVTRASFVSGLGTMSSFITSGDVGTDQTISDGNTLEFIGGTGIQTSGTNTDSITFNITSGIITDHPIVFDGLEFGDTDTIVFNDGSNGLKQLSRSQLLDNLAFAISGNSIQNIYVGDGANTEQVSDGEVIYFYGGNGASLVVSAGNTVTTSVVAGTGIVSDANGVHAKLVNYTQQTVGANGASTTTGRTYAVQADTSNRLVVNVPWVDTNTQLSTEQVQDIVGAQIVTNGSHTLLTATYDDGTDGGINLTVNNDLSQYSNASSLFFDTVGNGLSSNSSTVSAVDGTGIVVNANGIHANLTNYTAQAIGPNTLTSVTNRTYSVQVDASDKLVVNVPWVDTDTDTTYSAGTLLDLSGTTFNVDLSEATEASITNGDYLLFLDGGATGTAAKESFADFATYMAGAGMTSANSVINVVGGDGITVNANEVEVTVDGSTIELSATNGTGSVRVKDLGITTGKLANGAVTEAKRSRTVASTSVSVNPVTADVNLCTAGSGGITLTLPSASGNTGKIIYIKKIDAGAGNVIISGTIDGGSQKILYYQYESMTVVSNGTSWYII